MSKVIVYNNGEKLVVCQPVFDGGQEPDDFSLKRIAAKDVPEEFSRSASVMDSSDLPAGRLFRDAWAVSGGRVQVDMAKARNIHLANIRAARDAKISSLDREEMAAMGTGDQYRLEAVRSAKQILRDIPSAWKGYLEGASTPEALDGMWPVELDRRGNGDNR